jgi:hypothetical protein
MHEASATKKELDAKAALEMPDFSKLGEKVVEEVSHRKAFFQVIFVQCWSVLGKPGYLI